MAAKNPVGTMQKNDVKGQTSNALQKLFGVSSGEAVGEGLKLVPPAQIEAFAQPRTSFPTVEIEELAASIQTLREKGGGVQSTGILQPLLVRLTREAESVAEGTRYILVAGERRLRAARLISLPQVPVIVLSGASLGDPSLTLTVQIIENLQRRDLPPLEEARALQGLMRENQVSIREAAVLLGKPKSYLSDRLALLKMGDDVQQMVSERSDTLLHARIVNNVSDPDLRLELLESARRGASLRDLQNRALASPSKEESTPLSERSDSSGLKLPQGEASPPPIRVSDGHRPNVRTANGNTPSPTEVVSWQLDEAANAIEQFVIQAQKGASHQSRGELAKMKTAANRLEGELGKLHSMLNTDHK